jgi:hypothetical protein
MNAQQMMDLVKTLRKDATTQGITTGTGLNFYYLEEQAKAIYPVFYPLLASISRVNAALFGNQVGGTGVNWKAITGIDVAVNGQPGYPAISEGNRNAFMALREKDYFAAYKFIGKDGQVTFQAQKTGLGFEDNLNMTQVALLNALLNDEERQILYGNSGSAGNGYQLGTTNTPVAALVTGGTITGGTNVSLFCVALTPWGVFLAGSTGVQLPWVRQNSNGSTDTINGGTAIVSAASNVVTTAGATLAVSGTVTAMTGAVGYAWFVDSTDASAPKTSNAFFSQVTSVPSVTILALPSASNQAANAVAVGGGSLLTDNSANALDFDGLMTWGFNYASASPANSYVKDLGGANLTANGDGTIAEFETLLDFLWSQYKLTPDRIYLGGTLIDAVAKKITGTGVSNAVTRLLFERDEKGALTGGTFPIAYRSKYGPGQAKVMDVLTHPWLPNGVIYFDLINNPYPAAGDAIPAVRRIITLEDHFSIKWPYRTLQHEVGTYCFLTLQHYIPFGIGILTGVGNG